MVNTNQLLTLFLLVPLLPISHPSVLSCPRVFFPLPTSRCTSFSLFFVLSCSFLSPFLLSRPAPPRAGSTAFSSYVSFACFGFPASSLKLRRFAVLLPLPPGPAPLPFLPMFPDDIKSMEERIKAHAKVPDAMLHYIARFLAALPQGVLPSELKWTQHTASHFAASILELSLTPTIEDPSAVQVPDPVHSHYITAAHGTNWASAFSILRFANP